MDTTATAAETTTTTTTSAAAATPIATTEGNTENTNGARTVRSNWLIYSWNRISRAHKAILIMSLILVIFQVAVTVTVLAIGSSQVIRTPRCEQPLQLYLIIYVIRVGLSCPLVVYQHLSRPSRQQPNPEQSRSLMSGWAYRLKSLLDLFAILWFIVGNYLIFSPSGCSEDASLFYYTILAWIILGYALLLIPVFVCISVIFCLPVVLVAMRAFNINISTVMEGGSKEELDKIPIFRYKAHTIEQSPEQEQQGCAVPTPVEGETTKRSKSNFIRRWMKRRHGVTEQEQSSHIEALTIPRSEDAICSICLSEYENDDLLCKLWCGHIYHRDCVKEWLSLNATCPLCKRDFRGKDFNHENRDEEEY